MGGGSRNNNGGSTGTNGAVATEAAASGTATTVMALVLLLVAASLVVFFLSPTPPATRIGYGGEGASRPEPVELAIGLAGHESWLDAVRAWAKLAFLKLRPPEPRYDLRSSASVTAAAKETLEMGKETVEHAAESAAKTLGKTTVKLKRKVSSSSSPPAGRLDGDL